MCGDSEDLVELVDAEKNVSLDVSQLVAVGLLARKGVKGGDVVFEFARSRL